MPEGSNHALFIRTAEELQGLKRWRPMPAPVALVIEIPGLSQPETRAASERIVRFAQDCGCALGAKCMTISLAGMAVYIIWSQGLSSAGFFWHLPLLVPSALFGATAGKLIGLGRAHRRLAREIDRLVAGQPSLDSTERTHA